MNDADSAAAVPRPRRLTEVFTLREFRALWSAEVVSILGDQLARVAFSVLVYERTSSAALSAAVYALTFLLHCSAAHCWAGSPTGIRVGGS